jgi:amidase
VAVHTIPRPKSALGVLVTAAILLATVMLVPSSQAAPPNRPFPVDLTTATIPELQGGLAAGRFTSEQLTNAYLARIQEVNSRGPSLHAVRVLDGSALAQARALDAERARGHVRGPMHGIPVLVKDNIDVKGLPTTAGALALENSRPSGDAFLVKRLRAAGAIVLGKANLTEFANFVTSGAMPSGYSSLGGQVLNPYDATQTPSGSSSGSAVAAATALAAVTVGTETSGSILSPSVANSDVGIKPTVGLVSRTGVVPISATQDTAGPITRSVFDAAALLTALTGRDPEDPATADSPTGIDYTKVLSADGLRGARIGVTPAPSGNQGTAYNQALDVMRAQGATLVDVTVDTGNLPPDILTYEFKRDLNAYLARLPKDAPMKTLHDVVQFNIAHAAEGTIKFGQDQLVASDNVDLEADKAKYEADRDAGLAAARDHIDSVLKANDLTAIVFPGAGSAGIGARAQYPSVAVQIGYNPANGRPFGVTFLGTRFSEAKLLPLAFAYEQAAKVWRPPVDVNPSLFRCTPLSAKQTSCAP